MLRRMLLIETLSLRPEDRNVHAFHLWMFSQWWEGFLSSTAVKTLGLLKRELRTCIGEEYYVAMLYTT